MCNAPNRQLVSDFRRRLARRLGVLVTTGGVAAATWSALGLSLQATSSFASLAGQVARTTSGGVYTPEQAARGRESYLKECASCHSENLQGGDEAPGLVGAGFLSQWVRLSTEDLLERTRMTMPQDRPGKLSRAVYVDILAHVFKVNGFPTGGAELPSDAQSLKDITITDPPEK